MIGLIAFVRNITFMGRSPRLVLSFQWQNQFCHRNFYQCCFTLITMLPTLLPQNPFFRIKIDTFLSILFENPKIGIFILELVRTLSIELQTSCDWESDSRIFEDWFEKILTWNFWSQNWKCFRLIFDQKFEWNVIRSTFGFWPQLPFQVNRV